MEKNFYKPFSVGELGVDSGKFLENLRPIYDELTWDPYDVERGGLEAPTRKRAVAEIFMERQDGVWNISLVDAKPYVQPTNFENYNRTIPRFYPQPPKEYLVNEEMFKLYEGVADIISSVRSDVRSLRVILTFLRTVDEEGRQGICALEGMPHSDGMEYIVSALVINRQNLKADSGVSSVHSLDGSLLYKSVLLPGEGILQDDQNLLHDISNIRREVASIPGVRDMLGFDFIINPS